MTDKQFSAFLQFRNMFLSQVTKWQEKSSKLILLQKEAAKKDTPDYEIETSVVYNSSLDNITKTDVIKLIIIGDNPGKDEQKKINNKYLVGQSGKLAESFFHKNKQLDIDFRKNTIILNKTPIHTAKTNHLRFLKNSNEQIKDLILESQLWMASQTAKFHQTLFENALDNEKVELWLVGYTELKQNGIFLDYRDKLKNTYTNEKAWENVRVYQHFSMNRFSIDLNNFCKNANTNLITKKELKTLGIIHRKEIFGK